MITINYRNKEIHVPDDTSLNELANYLHETNLGEPGDYKIYIDGTDENTNIAGQV